MNTLNVICFLSIARTKSFTITAQELNITQQAVSRKIQKMEQELGFPLFHRNYNMATLTQAGERYYRLFTRFEQDLALAESRFPRHRPRQALCLGWEEWTDCPDWVRSALEEFTRSFGVEVNLCCMDETEIHSHATMNVDLLLSSHYSASHSPIPHTSTSLAEVPLYLVAGKQDADRMLNLNAQNARLLHHIATPAGREDREEVAHRCNSAYIRAGLGYGPSMVSVLPNLPSVLLEVYMGVGVTIVPGSYLRRLPEDMVLRPLNLSMTLSISREPRPDDPMVEMLEEFLCSYAEKQT